MIVVHAKKNYLFHINRNKHAHVVMSQFAFRSNVNIHIDK